MAEFLTEEQTAYFKEAFIHWSRFQNKLNVKNIFKLQKWMFIVIFADLPLKVEYTFIFGKCAVKTIGIMHLEKQGTLIKK